MHLAIFSNEEYFTCISVLFWGIIAQGQKQGPVLMLLNNKQQQDTRQLSVNSYQSVIPLSMLIRQCEPSRQEKGKKFPFLCLGHHSLAGESSGDTLLQLKCPQLQEELELPYG